MNQDQLVLLETEFGVKVTFGLNNCSWIHCYSIYRISNPPHSKTKILRYTQGT